MEKKDIINWTKALPKEAEWVEIEMHDGAKIWIFEWGSSFGQRKLDSWANTNVWNQITCRLSETIYQVLYARAHKKCHALWYKRNSDISNYHTTNKFKTIKIRHNKINQEATIDGCSVGRSVGYILHFVWDINCKLITSLHCDFIHIFPVLFNVMQMIKSVNLNWDHFRIDKSNRQSITITKKAHHFIV